MEVYISNHARFEAERRNITMETVMGIAQSPQQVIPSFGGKTICQSIIFDLVEKKEMLVRVVAKDMDDSRFVVTVYKTSKINKYWK